MNWPKLCDLFPPATWTGRHEAQAFPADPYPGVRPDGSFIVETAEVRGVNPSGDGWIGRDTGEPISLDGRSLVLAYGSNGNPQKLAERLGITLVLRCAVRDHAAVWCEARRSEGSVVATIAPDPGHIEMHHVLAVTERQLDCIDRWEGHPRFYKRQSMPRGSVLLESGVTPREVLVYVGTLDRRPPLLVNGALWRTGDHTYDRVDAMVSDLESSYE